MRGTVALAIACAALYGCGADDEHVGSRDCEVIADSTDDPATAAACSCQNVVCGTLGCLQYPCVEGHIVIQGCLVDEDCAEFPDAPRCGMHSAADHICTSAPDDR